MNLYKTLGAAVLAVGLTTSAFAVQDNQENAGKRQWKGQRMGAGHRAGGMMFGRAASELNLTDTQKQFAKQLMQDTRAQAKPLHEQLRQNRQELEAAVKANNTSAITQLTERQATLRGQISEMRAKAMASFYAQLTPEQKAKAEELKAQRQQRFENRRQNRQNASPRNNG